jgi:hypothetical protein
VDAPTFPIDAAIDVPNDIVRVRVISIDEDVMSVIRREPAVIFDPLVQRFDGA